MITGLSLMTTVAACSGTAATIGEDDSDGGSLSTGDASTHVNDPVTCTSGTTRTCTGPGACAGGQSCEEAAWSTCDCGSMAIDSGSHDDSSAADAASDLDASDASTMPDARIADATPPLDANDAAALTCPGYAKYTILPGQCLYFEMGRSLTTNADGSPKCSPSTDLVGGSGNCAGIANNGSAPFDFYLSGTNFLTYSIVNGDCPVQVTDNCMVI